MRTRLFDGFFTPRFQIMEEMGGSSGQGLNEAEVKTFQLLIALGSYAKSKGKRLFRLSEVGAISGINDQRELTRYLYRLEGHKLVSADPPGNFTSENWYVTDEGHTLVAKMLKKP